MKIGVISDTHGLLREEASAHLADVDLIIHAGDIGDRSIIEILGKIAPTKVIRGNNDLAGWASNYPETTSVKVGRRKIYILHDLKELHIEPTEEGYDIVVSGHSHKPKIETRDGVLYLNPGSAGPRRFSLPITLALLDVNDDGIAPRILDIKPA